MLELKPWDDIALIKQKPPISLFGILSDAFTDELLARIGYTFGCYRLFPLEYLLESDDGGLQPAPYDLRLNLSFQIAKYIGGKEKEQTERFISRIITGSSDSKSTGLIPAQSKTRQTKLYDGKVTPGKTDTAPVPNITLAQWPRQHEIIQPLKAEHPTAYQADRQLLHHRLEPVALTPITGAQNNILGILMSRFTVIGTLPFGQQRTRSRKGEYNPAEYRAITPNTGAAGRFPQQIPQSGGAPDKAYTPYTMYTGDIVNTASAYRQDNGAYIRFPVPTGGGVDIRLQSPTGESAVIQSPHPRDSDASSDTKMQQQPDSFGRFHTAGQAAQRTGLSDVKTTDGGHLTDAEPAYRQSHGMYMRLQPLADGGATARSRSLADIGVIRFPSLAYGGAATWFPLLPGGGAVIPTTMLSGSGSGAKLQSAGNIGLLRAAQRALLPASDADAGSFADTESEYRQGYGRTAKLPQITGEEDTKRFPQQTGGKAVIRFPALTGGSGIVRVRPTGGETVTQFPSLIGSPEPASGVEPRTAGDIGRQQAERRSGAYDSTDVTEKLGAEIAYHQGYGGVMRFPSLTGYDAAMRILSIIGGKALGTGAVRQPAKRIQLRQATQPTKSADAANYVDTADIVGTAPPQYKIKRDYGEKPAFPSFENSGVVSAKGAALRSDAGIGPRQASHEAGAVYTTGSRHAEIAYQQTYEASMQFPMPGDNGLATGTGSVPQAIFATGSRQAAKTEFHEPERQIQSAALAPDLSPSDFKRILLSLAIPTLYDDLYMSPLAGMTAAGIGGISTPQQATINAATERLYSEYYLPRVQFPASLERISKFTTLGIPRSLDAGKIIENRHFYGIPFSAKHALPQPLHRSLSEYGPVTGMPGDYFADGESRDKRVKSGAAGSKKDKYNYLPHSKTTEYSQGSVLKNTLHRSVELDPGKIRTGAADHTRLDIFRKTLPGSAVFRAGTASSTRRAYLTAAGEGATDVAAASPATVDMQTVTPPIESAGPPVRRSTAPTMPSASDIPDSAERDVIQSGAVIPNRRLRDLALQGTAITDAAIPGVIPQVATIPNAIMPGTVLPGLALQSAVKSGALILGVALEDGATLQSVTQSGTTTLPDKLPGARLSGERLRGAAFRGFSMRDSAIRDKAILNGKIMGATIPVAKSEGTAKSAVTVPGATLRGATIQETVTSDTSVPGTMFRSLAKPVETIPADTLRRVTIPGITTPGAGIADTATADAAIAGAPISDTAARGFTPALRSRALFKAAANNRLELNETPDVSPGRIPKELTLAPPLYSPGIGPLGHGAPVLPTADQGAHPDNNASLPGWARNFLNNSFAHPEAETTIRSGAISRQGPIQPEAQNTTGNARRVSRGTGQEGQVIWTAPGYNGTPPKMTLKQAEEKETSPPRFSNAEISRMASKVYDILEDRISREKRRLGL